MLRTLALVALLVAPLAHAEPEAPIATVDDLDWMVGSWAGEGLGGRIEETVEVPAGGAMHSTFRLSSPDGTQVGFYEFMLYENTEAGVQLLVHHFSPGMRRWEDTPAAFDLVELDDQSVLFAERDDEEEHSRLQYEREGDTLRAKLIEERDGEDVVTARFAFSLVSDRE